MIAAGSCMLGLRTQAPEILRHNGGQHAPICFPVQSYVHVAISGLGWRWPQIWNALENPRTFDDLIGILRDRFDVDESKIRSDMHAFLLDMKSEGLVLEA
ncbi:MAG: PqqD family protein [Novosphingobium sp.]